MVKYRKHKLYLIIESPITEKKYKHNYILPTPIIFSFSFQVITTNGSYALEDNFTIPEVSGEEPIIAEDDSEQVSDVEL